MMRFIILVVIIGVSVATFLLYANPTYREISLLRDQVKSYNQALDNSKALENERDKLIARSNAIAPTDIEKLEKLLPAGIDNIRLILEMGEVALPYDMVLKDVKYSTTTNASDTTSVDSGSPSPRGGVTPAGAEAGTRLTRSVSQDYGIWDLEFSISGTYDNFINFTKDLERNLRIVDVVSVKFSSDNTDTRPGASAEGEYNYDFKIKTYWLKN